MRNDTTPLRWQITRIAQFYRNKQEFDVPPPASLCVFCGSRFGAEPAYAEIARRLGRTLAEQQVTLVYGGGGVGLMGIAANAALAAGGRVVGIIPQFLFDREAGHPDLTELVVVKSMHQRKLEMFERSDGFIVLPGGLGTLEEFFEVLSWRTLGLHEKPIVIVDHANFWKPLAELLNGVVSGGFADARNLDHVAFVTRIEDVLPTIAAMPRGPIAEKKLDKL
jgi:uncharacterized protein (TIGR00730 family)